MSRPSGTHDPRMFRHFAKMAADGSVAAIVEVADGTEPQIDAVYVEVTDLYPYDLSTAKAKPADVLAAKGASQPFPTSVATAALLTVKTDLARMNTVPKFVVPSVG